MNVFDSGENKIFVKCLMNDSKKENEIRGDFFLPHYGTAKIVLAGSGQSCLVKYLKGRQKSNEKGKFADPNASFINEQKHCDCCSVF